MAQGLPVVAGFEVYNNLYRYRGGIYDSISGSFIGGHAMCIVGYDDSERVVKIVNSWGTRWGEDGFLRISYDIWPRLATRSSAVLYDKVENTPEIPEPSPPFRAVGVQGRSV